MKRFVFIALTGLALAALVGASLNNLAFAGPAKLSFFVRECKARGNEASGRPEITAGDGVIQLRHELNNVCCANLSLNWKREGSSISIVEAGDGCEGACDYLIQADVTGLGEGDYVVKVFGADGLLAQESVVLK